VSTLPDPGALRPAEEPQARGPHRETHEERRVAELQGGLVRLLHLPVVEVPDPEPELHVRKAVRVALQRGAADLAATIPAAEQCQQVAHDIQVSE
jgi:hypothetical protein